MADDISVSQVLYLGAFGPDIESPVSAQLGFRSELTNIALKMEQGEDSVWLNDVQLNALRDFLADNDDR